MEITSWQIKVREFLSNADSRYDRVIGSCRFSPQGVCNGRNYENKQDDLHLILYVDTSGVFGNLGILNQFISAVAAIDKDCEMYHSHIDINLFTDSVYYNSGCEHIDYITPIETVRNGESNIASVYGHILEHYSVGGGQVEDNIDSIIIVSDKSLAISSIEEANPDLEDIAESILYLLPGVQDETEDGYLSDAELCKPTIEDFISSIRAVQEMSNGCSAEL